MDPLEAGSPQKVIERVAKQLGCSTTSRYVAEYFDQHDKLRDLRQEFLVPKVADLTPSDLTLVDGSEDCIYFVGNSLGLQPKNTKKYIDEELEKWAKIGAHGHVMGSRPWAWAENNLEALMAKVVGAKPEEVALLNGLTVNLHLLMYAVESQIRLRGFDPSESMVLLKPRAGEDTLRTEDIVSTIKREGDSVAVVMLGGVQYYTGQLFNMEVITKAGQAQGCYVGFDCAHAAGNAELRLHDWGVDFACWCTYKYMNSGAGGLAGAYIHEKHANTVKPALLGWWGHKLDTRFQMTNVMSLQPGISGFRLSNQPILLVCPLQASLEIFNKTTMRDLRKKSILLTGYLEHLLTHYYSEDKSEPRKPHVRIITPSNPAERGCQLSLSFSVPIRAVFQELEKRGVTCDMREPNVLRVAPVPLYNSFTEVHRFITVLGAALEASKQHN
ncbi:kynureninase isoform X2 [Pangasianodon hypophthalmus]|uniref:kynureninase isoform X2 n=1 Tax=Pangasianodon hypophthalmus TaxID=310915 RepID=UPI002306FABE|nr:kynureninase isoform X2 [Pangasianodon hypophthalmus]